MATGNVNSPEKTSYGYTRAILRVNLTTGTITKEKISEELCRRYLGGSGFVSYYLWKEPKGGISILESGCRGEMAETPKSLSNAINYIIGDNRIALEAMAKKARQLGFTPLIVSSEQTGETANVARQRAREIFSDNYKGYDALLIGGETLPELPDKPGRGGRNQHYAAVTLEQFVNYNGDWLLASIGTDGSDFIPEVAGAIVDRQTIRAIESKNVDIKILLERYDSYTLLNDIGNSLVITGNTHTNVGDVILYLFRSNPTS